MKDGDEFLQALALEFLIGVGVMILRDWMDDGRTTGRRL